jgi:hypothetical protein
VHYAANVMLTGGSSESIDHGWARVSRRFAI